MALLGIIEGMFLVMPLLHVVCECMCEVRL